MLKEFDNGMMAIMGSSNMLEAAAENLLQALQYLPTTDQERVALALEKAEEWHRGQMRESGEPYVTHPIAVARYLADLEADRDTLIAALLHDVVEDDRGDMRTIETMFGVDVARLVEGVTKLTKLQYEGRPSERQVASLRKMLIQASNDLRVICIKLADRWHNISTIDAVKPEKRQRIARETLDIYVPFARIVGLWELKEYFEDRCFPLALPEEHTAWHQALLEARGKMHEERMAFVARLNADMHGMVTASMTPMTEYELFLKMRGNITRLSETHNIDSILVTLEGTEKADIDCYRVLGQVHHDHPVHTLYFRDYISTPQPNGYKALHTVIFLGRGHEIRLRIQTRNMMEYVTRRKISTWLMDKNNDVYTALASVQAAHKDSANDSQYLEDIRSNVLDRMNVFTAWGEVVTLPRGATGIDFTFAVGPDDVANLAGVRINGDLKQATSVLQDGDTVEVVVLEANRPELRALWVDKAKSAEAREQLKAGLSQSPIDAQRESGRTLLEHECRKRKLPIWPLFRMPRIQKKLVESLGTASFDDVLTNVGIGMLPAHAVLERYQEVLEHSQTWTQKIMTFLHLLPRKRVLNRDAQIIKIEISAQDRPGMIYDITKCVAERDLNIAQFEAFAVPPGDALYKITLEVKDFTEFSDLYDNLIQVPNVKYVLRKK